MKTHYLKSKIFALATMVFMILALVPMNAMADDTSSNNNAPSEKYIMMNVPYSDFYGQKIPFLFLGPNGSGPLHQPGIL